ncbi:MAG: PIN domain-containing protein [Edaphobacter sp.]
MNQIFADTGYWIALLNPRDELHNRAQEISATLGPAQIVTSEWVLTELLNSFAERGVQLRTIVSRTVTALRSNPGVTVVPQTSASFEDAFQLYQDRSDKGWSVTDCSSFLIMRQYGIGAALTYDRHFEQANFQALLR